MIKPKPPEPPPMRIGDNGDTIDRAGVRRKSDGSLRTWYPEHVFPLVGFGVAVALLIFGLVFG
jgi:hypothetical protein